jgi:hypothetical protein
VVLSEERKSEAVLNFFDSMLGTPPTLLTLIQLDQLELLRANWAALAKWFSEEEVWSMIRLLPPDKAPGPDGFTTRFMQVAWPIIHPVLMAAFDAWWCLNTRNFHDVNGVLMVLLPKNKEPAIVRDYRPISLIHIVGKLFSKVLVSHLAPKLGELVQPNQSAFVMGWLIHDSFKFIQSSA